MYFNFNSFKKSGKTGWGPALTGDDGQKTADLVGRRLRKMSSLNHFLVPIDATFATAFFTVSSSAKNLLASKGFSVDGSSSYTKGIALGRLSCVTSSSLRFSISLTRPRNEVPCATIRTFCPFLTAGTMEDCQYGNVLEMRSLSDSVAGILTSLRFSLPTAKVQTFLVSSCYARKDCALMTLVTTQLLH